MKTGFKRTELQARYDVTAISEDEWHSYSGEKTSEFLTRFLKSSTASSQWLLNAGAGIYEIKLNQWREVIVDLFTTPIRSKENAVLRTLAPR